MDKTEGLKFLATLGAACGIYVSSYIAIYQIVRSEIPIKIINKCAEYKYTTMTVSAGVAAGSLYYLSNR